MLAILTAAALAGTVAPAPPSSGQWLVTWVMSPAVCRSADGAHAERVVRAPDPQQGLSWGSATNLRPIALDFRIDAAGRPLSITRATPAYVPYGDDIVPAFVASRFAPGNERSRCTVTFTPRSEPIAAAPIPDLIAYSITPNGPPPRELWDRIKPIGSTCTDPEPAPLLRAFPDFTALPDQSGYRSWSVVGHDLDAAGKPINTHTIASSGVPALDRASLRAVARSRFQRGARSGCVFRYWKGPATLPAPAAPEEASVRPVDATCPREHDYDRKPTLRYPANYNRRSIEGYAIIAFDVASWGQTGNIRVLSAEPASDFGEAATTMIREVTMKPLPHGYTGCVERVFYRIRKPGMPMPSDAPPVAVD